MSKDIVLVLDHLTVFDVLKVEIKTQKTLTGWERGWSMGFHVGVSRAKGVEGT